MADAIEIYLDLSKPSGAAVKGLNDSSSFLLGPFYQGSLLRLRVFPVVWNGSVLPTPGGQLYSQVSLTNLELRVAVGPRAGAEAVLAYQPTWAKQSALDSEGKSGYFYADLDLATSALNTAISTNDSLSTYIEFALQRSGATNFQPVYQQLIQVLAVVKDPAGASSVPTPADQYLTSAQNYNLFVAWDNSLIPANSGRLIRLVSPDGTRIREIGIGNNGEMIDNVI